MSVAMTYNEFFSALAIAITFAAYFPYIRSILRHRTRPHVFSWIIWGSVTIVVFFAQLADRGGVGAWPLGISGSISLYVAILAWYRKGDATITRLDWIFLCLAATSLPLWYFTNNPLSAVLVLTIVDLIGFGPTFRQGFHWPFYERSSFYAMMATRNAVAIVALENLSLTTVLFPAATGLASILFVAMVLWRRRQTGHSHSA